jgi:hypothetical protein
MSASREQTLIAELLAPNRGERGDLYAILDGARDDAIHELTRQVPAPWMYLEDGIVEARYQVCAPRVLAVDDWPPAMFERLLASGWGQSWGVFVRTKYEFQILRRHLRSLSNARLPTGRVAQFRFYDPRVLRVYLPTCTTEELAMIFGPIEEFMIENDDPATACRYVLNYRRLKIETFDVTGEAEPERPAGSV